MFFFLANNLAALTCSSRGGPLTGSYRFTRQIFTFTKGHSDHGSEHMVGGVRYAAEVSQPPCISDSEFLPSVLVDFTSLLDMVNLQSHVTFRTAK